MKDANYFIDGVRAGDRRILSRAITLVESGLLEHQQVAREVIDGLLPHTGNSIRLGITGVPGAGKSTFIEFFGNLLTEKDLHVAVLAIDPSSSRSGGSILGDKTRMEKLAVNGSAFIRPSPSGGTLGGVAGKTRESMLLCEAAGFDVVIIETVGVGQSETAVASMVDFFLILMIAGAGDELQGIKKGVLEVADAVVINKADGDNLARAQAAQQDLQMALHLLHPQSRNWDVPVMTCSSLEGSGIEEIWRVISKHRDIMLNSGELREKRNRQALQWFQFLLDEGLRSWFNEHPQVVEELTRFEALIAGEKISPTAAASKLLSLIGK